MPPAMKPARPQKRREGFVGAIFIEGVKSFICGDRSEAPSRTEARRGPEQRRTNAFPPRPPVQTNKKASAIRSAPASLVSGGKCWLDGNRLGAGRRLVLNQGEGRPATSWVRPVGLPAERFFRCPTPPRCPIIKVTSMAERSLGSQCRQLVAGGFFCPVAPPRAHHRRRRLGGQAFLAVDRNMKALSSWLSAILLLQVPTWAILFFLDRSELSSLRSREASVAVRHGENPRRENA